MIPKSGLFVSIDATIECLQPGVIVTAKIVEVKTEINFIANTTDIGGFI